MPNAARRSCWERETKENSPGISPQSSGVCSSALSVPSENTVTWAHSHQLLTQACGREKAVDSKQGSGVLLNTWNTNFHWCCWCDISVIPGRIAQRKSGSWILPFGPAAWVCIFMAYFCSLDVANLLFLLFGGVSSWSSSIWGAAVEKQDPLQISKQTNAVRMNLQNNKGSNRPQPAPPWI